MRLFKCTKDFGTKHGPGGAQDVGNPLKLGRTLMPCGHTPLSAMPDELPRSASYWIRPLGCAAKAAACAGVSPCRKVACCGVTWMTPNGSGKAPPAVFTVLKGTRSKLLAPIEENPVSCRHVPSQEK